MLLSVNVQPDQRQWKLQRQSNASRPFVAQRARVLHGRASFVGIEIQTMCCWRKLLKRKRKKILIKTELESSLNVKKRISDVTMNESAIISLWRSGLVHDRSFLIKN